MQEYLEEARHYQPGRGQGQRPRPPEQRWRVLHAIEEPPPLPDFHREPLPGPDQRLIVVEPYRPMMELPGNLGGLGPDIDEALAAHIQALPQQVQDNLVVVFVHRNGMVVEGHLVLWSAVGSNCNVSFLGGATQAHNGVFYVFKYITKNEYKHTASLALFHETLLRVREYPSRAANAGTVQRNAQYFVTVHANKIQGKEEISVAMAAAAILGYAGEIFSHHSQLVYTQSAMEVADSLAPAQDEPVLIVGSDTSSESDVQIVNLSQGNSSDSIVVVFSSDSDAAESEASPAPAPDQPAAEADPEQASRPRSSASLRASHALCLAAFQVMADASRHETPAADQLFGLHVDVADAEHDLLDALQPTGLAARAGAGTAPIYRGAEGQPVPCRQIDHYRFRGRQLEPLSLYNYASLIEVLKKDRVNADEDDEDYGANAQNTTFAFADGHPLAETHIQRLRANPRMPGLVGRCPKPPGPRQPQGQVTDLWRQQATKHAKYLLLCFQPWTVTAADGGYRPSNGYYHYPIDEFATFCQRCHDAVDASYGPNTYNIMRRVSNGLRVSHTDRALIASYRNRNTARWNQQQMQPGQTAADDEFAGHAGPGNDPMDDNYRAAQAMADRLAAMAAGTSLMEDNEGKAYDNSIADILQRLHNQAFPNEAPPPRTAGHALDVLAPREQHIVLHDQSNLQAIFNRLKADPLLAPAGQPEQHDAPAANGQPMDVDEQQARRPLVCLPSPLCHDLLLDPQAPLQLNAGQQRLLQAVTERILGNGPQVTLVEGGPGVGKTTWLKALVAHLEQRNAKVLCMAYTGIAASEMPQGRTVHLTLKYAVGRSGTVPSPQTLAYLRDSFQGVTAVIIDEVSMIGPSFLDAISQRLKLIKDNDLDFGGLKVLLIGDFAQLPPVSPSMTLPEAVLKATGIVPTPRSTRPANYLEGANLAVQMDRFELTEQMRAATDPEHTQRVQQLRAPDGSVTEDLLRSLKRRELTAEDLAADPDWELGPFLCSTNAEKDRINLLMAQQFGRRTNRPVAVWNLPIKNASTLAQGEVAALYANNLELQGVFVSGATAYLTANVQPLRGLANGSKVRFESLVFSDPVQQQRVHEQMMDAQPGSIVYLQDMPMALLVSLDTQLDDPDLIVGRTADNRPIIPLLIKDGPNEKMGNGNTLTYTALPAQLGIAMTFHKSQSKTFDRIIMDLNLRPGSMGRLSYEALLVAYSRVREGNRIRVLPEVNIFPGQAPFAHLLGRQPAPYRTIWLAGFRNGAGSFSTERARLEYPEESVMDVLRRYRRNKKQLAAANRTTGIRVRSFPSPAPRLRFNNPSSPCRHPRMSLLLAGEHKHEHLSRSPAGTPPHGVRPASQTARRSAGHWCPSLPRCITSTMPISPGSPTSSTQASRTKSTTHSTRSSATSLEMISRPITARTTTGGQTSSTS